MGIEAPSQAGDVASCSPDAGCSILPRATNLCLLTAALVLELECSSACFPFLHRYPDKRDDRCLSVSIRGLPASVREARDIVGESCLRWGPAASVSGS